MPIKELSTAEQIKILEDLDEQERLYDKNISLVKGDTYNLKYKHHINVEPEPLNMIQETFRQQPTIEAIKSVKNEIKKSRPKAIAPKVPKVREVVSPIPKDEPFDLGAVAAEEKAEEVKDSEETILLRKHNIPTEKEIEDRNLDVADIIVGISQYNKTVLGPQLAQLTKRGMKDGSLYQSIQNEVQVLKNYKEKLLQNFERQRVLTERFDGQGLKRIKLGRFYANTEAIKRGQLKLRKKNQSKIKGVGDIQVSEGVKHLLLKRFDPKLNYTANDYSTYLRICELSGHKPKKYSKLWDRIYVTNVRDAQSRLMNAIGEIKAGNNHPEVKNEVVSLADFLLKNNKLNNEEYKNLMNVVNE